MMKKILLIISFGILIAQTSAVFAEDEIVLDNKDFISNVLAKAQEMRPMEEIIIPQATRQQAEPQEQTTIESGVVEFNPDTLHHRHKVYDELARTVHNVYNLQIENTNVPSCLLKDPLTHEFEKGPLESIHTWGVVQMNMGTTIPEHGDTDTKFNMGLINVLIDGQFRGGKEDFRIMFDPTPQHNRGFMQQFIQDLYIESHRIPHHVVLVGNSRPGVGIEGAQSPYTLPFVNRSQISRNLANARKFGVRVKGNYSLVDYDFGGYSSDTYFREFFPGVEFNGWVNFKPLGKTDGRFGKLVTGGGIAAGEKHSTDFLVAGAYVGYEYKKLWARAEYANADGSNGGSGLTDKKRQGWYITLGYHINKKLEAIARYDEFDPDKTIANNNQREYTFGVNYYLKGQALKLILNYVFCQNDSKSDSHRIVVGTQIAI